MGFTIFIFSLIVVANMIPSLLVGLQRTTAIDYDAVAYRTAVILAEDPGEPSQDVDTYPGGTTKSIPWDNLNPRNNVGRIRDVLASGDSLRFGLAVSRQQPNILSQRKIDNFFDPSFTENDYRQMLIFGDIPYRYNVTLTQLDPATFQGTRVDSVGDPYPMGGYGYIRRYVKIKPYSFANITNTTHKEFNYDVDHDAGADPNFWREQTFTIRIDGSKIYKDSAGRNAYDAAHVIDPTQDVIWINLTGLRGYLNNSAFNDPVTDNPSSHSAADWALNPPNPDALSREYTAPKYATLKDITFQGTAGGAINQLLYSDYFEEASFPRFEVYYNDYTGVDDDDVTTLTRLSDEINSGLTDHVMEPSTDPIADPILVDDSIRIKVHLWAVDQSFMNENDHVDIIIRFQEKNLQDLGVTESENRIPHTLLSGTFDYNYDTVTIPPQIPGILEVAVW